MALEHATFGALVFILLLLLPVFWARRGAANSYVRKIPGIEAVETCISKAAEAGKAASFTTALTSLDPVFYACMGVLRSVIERVARLKMRILLPQTQGEVMALVENVGIEAYQAAGRGTTFDRSSLAYLSSEQFAFASGYIGLIQRENVGAAFMFGTFAGEALILAEAGAQAGANQVAACVNPEQVPFFVCACDYTIIGEELFAASAYLTRDEDQLNNLRGQDLAKLILLIIVVIGTILATFRFNLASLVVP